MMIRGPVPIQRCLLAAVVMGFMALYCCLVVDWMSFSIKTTTVGFIAYKGAIEMSLVNVYSTI